jgi:hypothetical protein
MAIATKSSVMAVVPEVVEGTPVAPGSATDYLAIQPDAAMTPAFESLTNDELRSSIGASKPILGIENPSFSMSHYLRASGSVAVAPNYGELIKACLGAESIASTEYDTVAASTVSVIKVGAGEGASFRRGEALLIKDGTNGFRIRYIHSISGDDLTIGFNLPTAPGTGVNLGRAVHYYPTNSAQPTVSVWHYLGNGGATQMLAGGRVVSISGTAEAGQLVNATYTVEGVAYYFNPVEITASTDTIDFDDGAARVATIAAGWYKTPQDLAIAVETAMNASPSADTFTVSYSNSTGRITIASSGATFELLFATGVSIAQSAGPKLGFAATDLTGALTYTGDAALSKVAPQTPSYDSADPVAAKNHEVMLGSATDFACFEASSVSFEIGTPKTNIPSICAASGVKGSVINERSVTFSVSALLEQHDASKFYSFYTGQEVRFQYSFGEKSGANWVPGKCGLFAVPSATITSFSVEDADGLIAVNLELQGFVDASGNDEVSLSFV